VLWGPVSRREEAAGVVVAALEGLGVLVHARAERALIDRLCDDLRHVGAIEHRIGEPALSPGPTLSPEQQRLIELLAGGATLGEAAQQLHLSRRTADRRLAEARSAFRVRSTPALLAAWARSRRSVEGR
jgi:DNA-binding NarL/FixJ family response regulator